MSRRSSPQRVGLVEACDDPALFAFPLWARQRVILRELERARVHAWALGRRSGKTTMCALAGLWDATLRPELDAMVRARERRHVVVVATNAKQARLVVQAARAIVAGSPLLLGLLESESADELVFKTGAVFSAFACTARGGRGWPISTLILDELAHFVDTEGNSAAESVWRALTPGTLQFGPEARVIASSTPWGSDGTFAELFARAQSGELDDAVAVTATTGEMNPTIEPGWLDREERQDPESFKSEYLAMFVGSGGAFFDPETVQAAVTLPGELRPEDGVQWVAGLDPAFSSDPFGLALVARDKTNPRRLLAGLVRSWLPPKRRAASLEEGRQVEDVVLAEVASTLQQFGARAVTDQFKSSGVVERLRRNGVQVMTLAMTAPTKDAAFGFLRGRLNEGSLELYEHTGLLRELRAVRTRYAAGRSSVVLPRVAGSHCDLAQALALAVLSHDRAGLSRSRATFGRGTGRIPVAGRLATVGRSNGFDRLSALTGLQVTDGTRGQL